MPLHGRYLLFTAMAAWLWASVAVADTVQIGVLAFRPKPETLMQWRPLADVLKRSMPRHDFIVTAYTYPELEQAVAEKKVDFVLTNPGHYVLLSRTIGMSAPLATLIIDQAGTPLNVFGGVIFARSDRTDIRQLGDIKGKNLVATATESLGGYQMQAYEMALAGVHLPQDARLQEVGMPHDNVVQAVLDGEADVGFVRSGVLEALSKEGKLDLSRIKILNQQRTPGFPLLLSTQLYPEWPFAALPHADENIARHIAAQLFMLEENLQASKAMKIHGFTTPSDYTRVEELLRELRLPPFDHVPAFTLHDVWKRYSWQIVIAIVAGLLIFLLSLSVLLMERKLRRKRLKLESEMQLRNSLLNALGEGVYGVDHQGRCIFVNPAAREMLGYSQEELIGSQQHELFHHHKEDGAFYPEQECPIFQSLADGKTRSGEEWFWRQNGTVFPVFFTVSPHAGEKGKGGAVVVFRDITERKRVEDRIRHQAEHDALTGLPNRVLLADRLKQAMASARRDKQRLALMYIDLDNFKPVNDNLGHMVGDWLLQQVSIRIRGCIRDSDTIARVGGDEFIVLLRTIDSDHDATFVAEKIRIALNTPFDMARQHMNISCSIGIAIYPDHAHDETELSNHADFAMYQAKENGRNGIHVFKNMSSPDSISKPMWAH